MDLGHIVQTTFLALRHVTECAPDERAGRFWEIDFEGLSNLGFRYLLVDWDGTLAPYHTYRLDEKVTGALRKAQELGFEVCVHSNCSKQEQLKMQEALEECGLYINVVGSSSHKKPDPRAYLAPFHTAGIRNTNDIEETIFVGDRVLTDVLGANILGMHTILVNRYSLREPIPLYFQRALDSFFLDVAYMVRYGRSLWAAAK